MLVGLVGVLFPLGVFMSHIAKGDVALATSLVALIWAVMARFDAGRQAGWWDGWIGAFVVLVLSFKHSSLFILLPLALGVTALVVRAEGGRALMRSLGRILVTCLISWPVLNIGLVLDFASFLEFQRIQSVMSVRMEGGGSCPG